MSYHEKKSFVSIITGLSVLVVYLLSSNRLYQSEVLGPDDLRAWSIRILTFIGIGIGVFIVTEIVFNIMLSISESVKQSIKNGTCDEKEIEITLKTEMLIDEMDKLIELKSTRVGFLVVGIGFIGALVSQVLHYPPFVLLNVIFLTFSLSSVLQSVSQIYFYRRGITNG